MRGCRRLNKPISCSDNEQALSSLCYTILRSVQDVHVHIVSQLGTTPQKPLEELLIRWMPKARNIFKDEVLGKQLVEKSQIFLKKVRSIIALWIATS
jgi:hypothetical protein